MTSKDAIQDPRADRMLTPREQRFVEEYAIDLNGTQAAIRAGYSPKTARSIASEVLQRPAVKAATRKALPANESRLQMLTAMAFYDPLDAIKVDPELGIVVTDPNVIQSVRRVRRRDPKTGLIRCVTSVKFVDRARALRELGRRMGWF
ncbi:MAG: terminase small subunit [Nitrospirota bacterium]